MNNTAVIHNEWNMFSVKEILSSPLRDFGSFSLTNLIDFVEDGVPFIKSESVKQGFIDKRNISYITKEVHLKLNKSVVREGDILYTKIGALGRVAIYDGSLGECNSNAATVKINVDKSRIEPLFFCYLLMSEPTFRELEKNIISTPPRINLGDISALKLKFPTLSEQKKIAKVLSTVDNLIDQTQKLIDKYTAVKQGMMADLFSRGIDLSGTPQSNKNYGQLRPSYEDAPELYQETELGWVPNDWDVHPVENVSIGGFKNGYFKDPKLVGSGKKLINVTELYQDFGIDITTDKVERIIVSPKDFEKYKVDIGDLFFTRSSLVLEGIAKSNIVRNLPEEAVFECHVMRLKPNKEVVVPEFLALFTGMPKARSYLMSMAKQVTMTTIAQPDMVGLPTPVPSLNEQQAIVEKIDAIDELIRKEKETVEKNKNIKKGLMQDLFTGKVTV
ncbi:restriction endonuclease subunit S [Pseudoalteromonas spongiae]|uniref:restriction endonuclease subunit S n=1 Tax=Pseudoalteromonas spongiae TaxID=298657 RepID=UPI0037354FD6